MALRDSRNLTPALPRWESLDPDRVVFSFDDESDTLMVHFFGRGTAAYSEPVSDGHRDVYFLRISLTSDDVVGVQIEDFRARFAAEYPRTSDLLLVAERLGSEFGDVERSRSPEEIRSLRPNLLASLLRHLERVAA